MTASSPTAPTAVAPAAGGSFEAPWIETDACTSCDECIKLNSKIFAYNDQKKAVIANPEGGPYADLVKAAEKCTASVIHPGRPRDPSAPGMDKLIRRAEKFD